MALSLGLDESYFAARYTGDPLVLFRIFNYPAPARTTRDTPWGVGEHTDYGLLTILRQDDVGGLQVKSRSRWIDGAADRRLVRLQHRRHARPDDARALPLDAAPRAEPAGRDRLSFPFFFDPAGRLARLPPHRRGGARRRRLSIRQRARSGTAGACDVTNTRFQPAAQAGLTAEQAPKLTLKWAFGFPNATSARAQPTIVGGRLFVGSQSGTVYALDAKTGCTIWTFQAKAGVRTGIVIGPRARSAERSRRTSATARANAYAIDAATGASSCGRGSSTITPSAQHHRHADAVRGPAVRAGRLGRRRAGQQRDATSAARSAAASSRSTSSTGALVWKTYTIAAEAEADRQEPRAARRGGARRAPASGRRRRSMPKRRVVYAATGNMYTEPQQTTSDAIMAFDLDSGQSSGPSQVTAEGRLRRRLQAAERGELSAAGRPRSRFRLRQLADARDAARRQGHHRHRAEVRRRLGVRSGQAGRRRCGSTARGKGSALGGHGIRIGGRRRAAPTSRSPTDRPQRRAGCTP